MHTSQNWNNIQHIIGMLTKEGHVEKDKIISNGITIKHMYILMSALFRCMYLVVS